MTKQQESSRLEISKTLAAALDIAIKSSDLAAVATIGKALAELYLEALQPTKISIVNETRKLLEVSAKVSNRSTQKQETEVAKQNRYKVSEYLGTNLEESENQADFDTLQKVIEAKGINPKSPEGRKIAHLICINQGFDIDRPAWTREAAQLAKDQPYGQAVAESLKMIAARNKRLAPTIKKALAEWEQSA